MMNDRNAVEAAVGLSCLCLDEERFEDWLEGCASDFRYSVQAYSPEIRRHMTWLSLDRLGLERLAQSLRMHQRDPGALMRHPSVLKVKENPDGKLESVSSVLVVRTAPDGTSALYAALRYVDVWTASAKNLLLSNRRVEMSTRVLLSDSGGSHVPL